MNEALRGWLEHKTAPDLLIACGVSHQATRNKILDYISTNDEVVKGTSCSNPVSTRIKLSNVKLSTIPLRAINQIACDLQNEEATRHMRGADKKITLRLVARMVQCAIGLNGTGQHLMQSLEDVARLSLQTPEQYELTLICHRQLIHFVKINMISL